MGCCSATPRRLPLLLVAWLLVPAAGQGAPCAAWPGEPDPLPTVTDSDPFLARWSELRARELRELADTTPEQRPGTIAALRAHAACLSPRTLSGARALPVRIRRMGLASLPPEPPSPPRGQFVWNSAAAPAPVDQNPDPPRQPIVDKGVDPPSQQIADQAPVDVDKGVGSLGQRIPEQAQVEDVYSNRSPGNRRVDGEVEPFREPVSRGSAPGEKALVTRESESAAEQDVRASFAPAPAISEPNVIVVAPPVARDEPAGAAPLAVSPEAGQRADAGGGAPEPTVAPTSQTVVPAPLPASTSAPVPTQPVSRPEPPAPRRPRVAPPAPSVDPMPAEPIRVATRRAAPQPEAPLPDVAAPPPSVAAAPAPVAPLDELPAPPPDPALLDAPRRHVRDARFEAALAAIDGVRPKLTGAEAAPLRAELEVLAATAALALGRSDDARKRFAAALSADPSLELDPAIYSPKLRNLLGRVRAETGSAP